MPYDSEIFETWSDNKTLRNMEPIHSETDATKSMKILGYFGQPMSFPIKYSGLWNEILEKLRHSLELFRQILNELHI